MMILSLFFDFFHFLALDKVISKIFFSDKTKKSQKNKCNLNKKNFQVQENFIKYFTPGLLTTVNSRELYHSTNSTFFFSGFILNETWS
jgi:hypothetical protein